jgi:hypothetical protein
MNPISAATNPNLYIDFVMLARVLLDGEDWTVVINVIQKSCKWGGLAA